MDRGFRLLQSIEQEIAYNSGTTFTGLTLKRRPDGWTVILRVVDDKGINWVSFTDGHNIADCFDVIAEALYTTNISLKWHKDRYAK